VGRTLTFYSYARQKLFVDMPSPDLVAYWRDSLRKRIPEVETFSGQLGLDAGCGEGRYTYCLAVIGAEVIGIDLSEAVTQAYARNRASRRAHIIQASIYQPPIRHGLLDFVMSTGVLHHLPDPEGGFAALVPLLHPSGSIHVWVYGLRQMSMTYQLSHLVPLRRLGSRLSPQSSFALSVPLGLALHLLVFLPVRLLARTGQTSISVNPQIRELARLPLRMHIAEVQDRIGVPVTNFLTEEELYAWYAHAGLRDVRVQASDSGRGWSASGSVPPLS
jgi:SAM-dependent methyltransferase